MGLIVRWRWYALLVLGGCGVDNVEHGQPDPFSDSASEGFVVDGSDGGDDGFAGNRNFPEPAQARCGTLPGDVAAIDDLASAWAVLALPGARDPLGADVETGSVRLRLGDRGLSSCDGTFEADDSACLSPSANGCGWGISLTLAPHELAAGTYDLMTLSAPKYAVAVSGPNATGTRAGTLVLHRMTADCVVGELQDIQAEVGEPLQNGGFIAEICERQCIPDEDEGC